MNAVVNRNGVDFTLSNGTWGKKSELAGQIFQYPIVTPENWETAVPWISIPDLCQSTTTWLRRVFSDIHQSNIDEKTGILNQAQMELDWADFSAGMAKISDIDEALEELYEQQTLLVNSDDFGATTKIKDENGNEQDVKTDAAIAIDVQMRENNAKIRPLKVQKATIEAKYGERAAKRKAAKEAKEAAAAKAKANATA